MSINDNFSNLSQLLSPKTNDPIPSTMPPHITLKQRHFLFTRDGNCGSGVHTPEDLFGSQEAEQEERPVSVGNHLRVNEVNAPDVTFDAESLPADRTPEKGEEEEEAD
jgi:hypothetical protein